jgi:hypothetical protein
MTAIKRHPGRPKGAKTTFKGIGKLAARLNVSTAHLRLVIAGGRKSVSLLRRIKKLARASSPKSKTTPSTL